MLCHQNERIFEHSFITFRIFLSALDLANSFSKWVELVGYAKMNELNELFLPTQNELIQPCWGTLCYTRKGFVKSSWQLCCYITCVSTMAHQRYTLMGHSWYNKLDEEHTLEISIDPSEPSANGAIMRLEIKFLN